MASLGRAPRAAPRARRRGRAPRGYRRAGLSTCPRAMMAAGPTAAGGAAARTGIVITRRADPSFLRSVVPRSMVVGRARLGEVPVDTRIPGGSSMLALVAVIAGASADTSLSPVLTEPVPITGSCKAALATYCGEARKSDSSGACLACIGKHQHALRAAGCSSAVVVDYCTVAPTDCVITSELYAGGAVPDNRTVCTKQIQTAIDACHAANPAGARVVVPKGAFKTGSLMLRSNLELHLEAGAGLYGSDDWNEYPVVSGLPFGTMFRALISGYNLTNVAITVPH